MWEVIDVYNSEAVGACPSKALNASRRLGPRQARTIRCSPTAGASVQDNADQATKGDGPARARSSGAADSKPAAAPGRGLVDRSQTGATPPGKIFSLSTRQCLSCAGPKSPAGHGRAFQAISANRDFGSVLLSMHLFRNRWRMSALPTKATK